MYLLITMAVGVIFIVFGAFNMFRALRSENNMLSQAIPARFILSGILLVLHQPLTTHVSAWISEFLAEHSIETTEDVVFWITVIVLVGVQCVVLPSWRQLAFGSLVDSLDKR